MKKTIGLVILLLLILFFVIKGCSGNKGEALVFKDKVLEKMIQTELKKDTIYASDVNKISGILIASDKLISFSGGGHLEKSIILFGFDSFEYKDTRYTEFGTIKSLEDLKYFTSLTSIKVYLQPNVDFNTIPNKGNITNLSLSQNKLTNIEFLNGYNKLIYLSLSSNSIVNLKGVETLSTLKRINLNSNDVEDISLFASLSNLENIDLTYNGVTDVTPLKNLTKLNYLSLYENGISDISPLANIKSLKKLYLNKNNITDISPLKDFDSFDDLNITDNPITNYDVIDHLDNVTK